MTESGRPVYAPGRGHSLLLAPSGSGKTTCGVMAWLLSTAAYPSHAIVVNDPKSGELAAQLMPALERLDRKVALVDETDVLGADNPFKVSLSPFGNIIETYKHAPDELIFATENTTQVLIPDPPDGDAKNQYWRDWPRSILEFSILLLLRRNVDLATPGGVWVTLSDSDQLVRMAKIEAQEADGQLAALAREIVQMAEHNPEHWSQHMAAATKALRIYAEGSKLHTAGLGPQLTHHDLLREKYVVFIVGNQKHIQRMGTHYGIHSQSLLGAIYDEAGPVDFILDECTNTPLKSLVNAMTTVRSYGAAFHFVAQSHSEFIRAFGKHETETIFENAVTKSFFGFASIEEAKRISEAIGEDHVLQTSFGLSSKEAHYSTNMSSSKERIFTPERLMAMPDGYQLLHQKGVGWAYLRMVAQHQIAPWCHGMLADNPREGPQRPADPKVTLKL